MSFFYSLPASALLKEYCSMYQNSRVMRQQGPLFPSLALQHEYQAAACGTNTPGIVVPSCGSRAYPHPLYTGNKRNWHSFLQT